MYVAGLLCASAAGVFGDEPVSSQQTSSAPSVEIDRDLLDGVLDKMPVQNWEQRPEEASAYNYLLARANEVPPVELTRHARRDLSYAHLMEEPSSYRGAIVYFEGRVRRLVRCDPPKLAANEGVKDLYEAWIFGTLHYANPICVLVTRLPEGIKPGERVDYPVRGAGYFFKRYRYRAADTLRDAPLLMGPTLTLNTSAESASPPISELLTWFVGFGIMAVAIVAFMAWWFWRSDRKTRRQMSHTHRAALSIPGVPTDESTDAPLSSD
jgi:hypothetical protein